MTTTNFNILKEIEPYYHPGFGEVVKSRKHYKELLKKYNCIEVGNEKVKTHLGTIGGKRDKQRKYY